MARIAADHIGLRDAAEVFGVSVDTLRRRIRDNQLDEAQLVQGPFGATWVLPRSSLPAIAAREQWELAGHRPTEFDVSRQAPLQHSPDPMPTIDLRRPGDSGPSPPDSTGSDHFSQSSERAVTRTPDAAVAAVLLVPEVTRAISAELSAALTENIEAELAAVREAITAAEVRAVAAEARSEALTGEQNRLAAQLKRAEADVEYWRSQHDRLDKELDRERTQRTSAETARVVAETEVREAAKRTTELAAELDQQRRREQELQAREVATRAELDQALMAMGWWSRRRLARVQARSSTRPRHGSGED